MDHIPALPKDDAARSVFWTDHVKAWEQSGLSQAAYAQQHHLPLGRLGYWKRKLLPEQSKGDFVQINVEPAMPVRIHHRSGTLIECMPGTDSRWLRELLGLNDASR
jgi:hypothetical protein